MPLGQSRLHIRRDVGRNSSENWLSIIFTLIFWFKGKVGPDGWYNIQLENSFFNAGQTIFENKFELYVRDGLPWKNSLSKKDYIWLFLISLFGV